MIRILFTVVLAALLAAFFSPAALSAQEPSVYVIDNANLWTGEGEPTEGSVVIRDGRIAAAGANVTAPAGAERIDAAGGIVTAGFVAAGTPLGLLEIDLEDSTRDAAPEGGEHRPVDPVRAAFSAADGFHPRSSLIPIARLGGVTSALSTPVGGLVPGTSAWIDLLGDGPDEMLARPVAALHVSLNDSGVAAGGGAMSSALTRLREVLEDARLYARSRAAYDRRGVRELSSSRLDLERIGEALAGRIPVVVRVSRAADITRTLALGREFRLRLVLAGAEEGWRVADEIAAAEVPVMVHPLQNLPSSFSRLGTRFDNAARLAAAGVRVILTTASRHGAHDVRKLRQEAGNAVAWGMPRDVALAAITSEPARVFGMGRDYGQLARGQVANVVVWNGDPFELTTWATHVFVRGRPAPMTSRQGRLFERYRHLPGVRQGHPGHPARSAAPDAEAE